MNSIDVSIHVLFIVSLLFIFWKGLNCLVNLAGIHQKWDDIRTDLGFMFVPV